MKILVPVRRVIDPYIAVRIAADGQDIVRDGQPHSVNPFDAAALARAAGLRREGLASELVAVAIAPAAATDVLRTALAMGADRALHVVAETAALPPFGFAAVLARLVEAERPDLVLIGKQASDEDQHEVPPLVAGLAGLVFLPDAHSIDIQTDLVRASFDLGGLPATATAPLPALIACDLLLATPGPLGLAQAMQAKRKPIATLALAEFAGNLPTLPQRLALAQPPQRPPCRFIDDRAELFELMRQAAEGRS